MSEGGMLDATAVEVPRLVDGRRTVAKVVDALAIRFAAPPAEVAYKLSAMLRDLVEKWAIQL